MIISVHAINHFGRNRRTLDLAIAQDHHRSRHSSSSALSSLTHFGRIFPDPKRHDKAASDSEARAHASCAPFASILKFRLSFRLWTCSFPDWLRWLKGSATLSASAHLLKTPSQTCSRVLSFLVLCLLHPNHRMMRNTIWCNATRSLIDNLIVNRTELCWKSDEPFGRR